MTLKDYPKTAEVLQDYYTTKMLMYIDTSDVPEDFKETIRKEKMSVIDVEVLVNSNPRHLFDFFDEQGIVISITYNRATNKFCYFVNTQQNELEFDTRIEADKDAVELAIVLLEKKLNSL